MAAGARAAESGCLIQFEIKIHNEMFSTLFAVQKAAMLGNVLFGVFHEE